MATDYEEKYLSLRDENTALKKKKNEQEATIKRMYTKLAIIEEALKKKRHAEESDNQEDPETGGKAGIPVKRDVETEKFITALKQENLALRKKTQSLKEKNRALEEKLRMAKLKPHSLRPAALAPTHAAAAAGAPKAKRSSNQDTLKAQHTFQGLTLDKQVENARKLHREAFSSELEQALKGRLVVAEKQLVKLQHENETLRSQGNTRGRSKTDNNDGTGSSDDDLDGKHGERRSTVSGIEVEQLRRELRDRQAQLAIMNARYDNLELNVAAEREIQEKTLDQMETMNRQVHKLRTQLQDATLEKDHLEARAAKASELEKELLLIRDQNRRLEERMTTLCESPFINDAFQRKERIDKLFDLEKLTEQQKFSINHMTDENQKLQVIIKELQNNLKVMKQAKDSLEQEMAKVKQSLNEERNARSAAAVRATNEIAASATPRELIPRPQPVSITIPTETEKRDACSSPLRVEQPLPMASQLSKFIPVVTRRYEDTSLVGPFLDNGENDNNVKHLRNRVHVLQMAHLKAMQELERCEKMLHAQTNINRELALEIEDLTSKTVSASSVLQKRIKGLELLAEERQQQILQLEAQVRQLKYAREKLLQKSRDSDGELNMDGSSDDESSDVESIPESLIMAAGDLAPGEQLLELLIVSGTFDRNVVSENSSTFILCDFYDFESQTTPLLMGNRPEYSFSSTFKVTVDGFFLRYLASETLILEVHQATRGDFKLIGRAFIRLSTLLQSRGVLKEHTLPVKSTHTHNDGQVIGTLNFVLRLSCPISEIWRLHLRSYPQDVQLLALEKKSSSQMSTADFLLDADEGGMEKHQVNELQITVFGCKRLRSYGHKKGNSLSRIPSSYVHYQLLGFPDVFTNIAPESANPEYDLEYSRQTFVMEIDACLLRFFSKFRLWLTVFDDQIELDGDSKDDGMIGRCGVLLSELANGESIRGWFPLLDRGDHSAGEISVLIQWKDPFQILQFVSSRRARGGIDRPTDLHVLDFDQQHAVMKLLSPDMDGRINYKQFLNYCLPSEPLELITAKTKERFEYAIDTQQISSVEEAFKGSRETSRESGRIPIAGCVLVMEKYGIFLSDTEMDVLKESFGPIRGNRADSESASQNYVVLHFLLQHINPRMSCSSRLLMHKLRHTVRGFLQQQQKKSKSSEFLSPARVFEQFDSNLSGQVSRAEFKRCLSVFGFELVDVEKEYAALVAVPHVKQEPVVSKEKDEKEPAKVKELDLDAEILVDTKSASHQMPTQPQRTINVSDTKTKDAAKTFNQASAAPSPTGEFQRRKQAFMDRMKAIASASSKSLVYEQLEKRHDQQRRTEESTARIAEMPRLDLINQQAARLQTPSSIHHDAAKTVQHQYRMHRDSKRQTEYAKRCSILSADLQLQKIFKRWTCGELETLQDELVGKIEAEIPEAKKTHMVSRKQFGFLLSQFPRVAIDPALLSQLMEYFSISPTNPKSVVAYHSLIHFICSISTEERVEEQVHHHTVLKVLEDICLVSPHALDTFVSVGDMNNTGSISFRRFQEALQRLGVNMPSKDLRVVMTLFDCNGIELLYHAFLHMIEQSPRSFQLKQVVSRCQRFGVSKLKERLLMYMNSIDGSMTRQDLQYLFMQESNEFVQFDPKDARVLFEMINADSEAGKIPINALIARLENAIKNGNGMEMREMGKYSMHKLRRLARNCRKLTCDTHAYLIAQFERFDWREQGVVSLDEFVAVAQQNGFQVLTPLQLKQIAKCFGAKLRGQFGINYRQFLDWTNPPPTIDIEEIETKLRRFAHAQAEQVTSKKVTKVLSNWQQVLASADTMKHKVLTRATFAEVVKIKLDLPLSDEEIRVVLYSYDRALEDQVDYEGFVQLNWGAASKAYADRKQVHFGKQVIPTVEVVQKIKTALKDSKKSGVSVLNAFKDASGGHNGFVDALAFVQGMKKVNVALTMDETLSVLAVYGESPDRNKLDYQKFAKDVLGLPFGRTGGHPEVVLKEEDEQRLTAAIVSAMTYSRGAFQQSFLQFQEFCVVRRFSEIGTNTFWKHMESNGLVEILSRRGVGLLSQKFLVQCEPDKKQVSREDEQVSQEVISLKAVHSYLQEFLQNDATTALGSPMKQRAQSQNGREESGFSAMDSLRKLLSHCSDIGLDARGCFEKIDSQYSGYVTAMDMKQILLGLGISKFAQKTAPEAIIGHLVRQFRSTDSHDAVSYTLMLYEAFAFKPLSPELEWYARTSEHLRARIRLKADFSGKIDFGNPCIYRQLDACFAHFDRDRKGFLTPACLREGLASLKYELTDAQLQQLITQMGVYRNGTNSVSRMEFDSFALDPYAFSLLKNLAQDLYVSDRDQRGEIIPRIAQLSYAVMSHDNVEPKGVLSRQSFWTCLEDVLEKKLTQFAKFSLQHLFELKRDGMIAYKLFLKVTAQWRKSSLDCASLPKNPRTAELAHSIPRSERESIEKGDIRCSYQDLLQCLMRQLSTVDFYSQVDIVDEYLRRKDWQHTGTIKLKHLMRTFDQVGLSLSKDAIASLESYFAVNGDEKVIMYEKLIDALKALYEVTCEKNDEEEADAQRKRSSRDTHREHK